VKVVADTNVVVSGLLWLGNPGRLLESAANRQISLYTSPALVSELRGTLSYNRLAARVQRSGLTVDELLRRYLNVAVIVQPSVVPQLARDPDDDHVLACAQECAAELIVSGDSDLLALISFNGIDIVTAAVSESSRVDWPQDQMSSPLFCINERAFHNSVENDATFKDSMVHFLAVLEEILSTSERPLLIHQDVYYVDVDSNHTQLAALLYAEDGADRDVRLRLMIILGRCDLFDNVQKDQSVTVVSQGAETREVQSLAIRFVLEESLRSRTYFGIASRCEDGLHSGVASLRSQGNADVETLFVTVPRKIALAYRRAIVVTQPDMNTFFALSSKAFPKLFLVPGLDFRHFSGGYAGTLHSVCDHLSFLNDEFLTLAAECGWDYGSIIARARISLSDESPNTKGNKRAMRQREVRLGEKMIHCTLHTKLTPTRGRIHFHPPVEDLASDRVIVGIFTDHLET
jgi:uncharacterized protein